MNSHSEKFDLNTNVSGKLYIHLINCVGIAMILAF